MSFGCTDKTYVSTGPNILGWAQAASTGAKLARPDRPVVSAMGDGSALFGGPQPLWSQARYEAPITNIVVNNKSYNNERNRIWSFIVAIIYVIAGVWLIVNPVSGTITLTWVLAIFFLMIGLFRIIAGIGARGQIPNAGWSIVNGVLAVVIAVLVIANLPSSAAWAIGLLVGIQLLFDGIMMITAGMAAKKLFESGTV